MRHGHRVLIAVGILLIALAGAWNINAWLFSAHTRQVGSALIKKQRQAQAVARQSPMACRSDSKATGGLLVAPSIGLTAPVEQGTSDSVLSVAVGHDPNSVWPGTLGTSVLMAHDVSYFVNTDKLSVGSLIEYESQCTLYTFEVSGHEVVRSGSPVYNTPQASLALVTCWPTDALFFTPDRFIVTATEVKQAALASSKPSSVTLDAAAEAPTVPAPPALVSEGLTLATNSVPMGHLTVSGAPARKWVQSPIPLDVAGSGVEAFIGGIKATEQDQPSWWSAIAPGVALPVPLVGGRIGEYDSGLNIDIAVTGLVAHSVVLSTTLEVEGGSAPGAYQVRVGASIVNDILKIDSWSMTHVAD